MTDDDFGATIDACPKAHEAVMVCGTDEMRGYTTALLHALAREAARRAQEGGNGPYHG